MILDHVADGAGLVIEGAPALDSEILCHRDLHALDMLAIPERIQERIREAKEHYIVDRPLPEIVVDAEDRRLVEGSQKDSIEPPRRGQVRSEGLFDDNARILGTARFAELFHHQSEENGWNGEVVRRALRRGELFAKRLIGGGVLVVAVHIAQQTAQLGKSYRVQSAMLLEAVARPRPKLFEVPAGFGNAD